MACHPLHMSGDWGGPGGAAAVSCRANEPLEPKNHLTALYKPCPRLLHLPCSALLQCALSIDNDLCVSYFSNLSHWG